MKPLRESPCQKRRTPLGGPADPLGDPRLLHRPGCSEAGRKDDGPLEPALPDLRCQPPPPLGPGVSAGALLDENLVDLRTKAVEVCHPGAREDGEVILRKRGAERLDRGERHGDVPDPVRRPEEDSHAAPRAAPRTSSNRSTLAASVRVAAALRPSATRRRRSSSLRRRLETASAQARGSSVGTSASRGAGAADLARRRKVVGEDGATGGHRLDEDEGRAFASRGEEKKVRGGETLGDVPDLAGEGAARKDPGFPGEAFRLGAPRSVAEERERRVDSPLDDAGECRDGDVLPLESVEGPGVKETERGRGGRRRVKERLVRKAIRNDGDPLLRNPRFGKDAGDLRGDGDETACRPEFQARERIAPRPEGDAPVDYEGRSCRREAPDGGPVPAPVGGPEDVRAEPTNRCGDRGEEPRRRLASPANGNEPGAAHRRAPRSREGSRPPRRASRRVRARPERRRRAPSASVRRAIRRRDRGREFSWP